MSLVKPYNAILGETLLTLLPFLYVYAIGMRFLFFFSLFFFSPPDEAGFNEGYKLVRKSRALSMCARVQTWLDIKKLGTFDRYKCQCVIGEIMKNA